MKLAGHLEALESELLSQLTRKDAARVASLLADTFREFGSSGRIYGKEDIVQTLQKEPPVSLSFVNFEMMLLSEKVALVTYRSQKNQEEGPPSHALRSSIWVQQDGDWQMVFHQGTKLP